MKDLKVYRCPSCGKMVISLKDSECPTICCGQPMQLLTANTTDGAREKHVPVVTREGNTVSVNVGSVDHPMISEHLFLSRDKSKTTAILKYCNEHNINLEDVIFVDDEISFLMEAERKDIRSFRISSFLDWEYSML